MATFFWPLVLLATIAYSQATPNPNPITTTASTGCTSNYAFVTIESSLLTLSETVASQRVHYSPYSYTQTIPQTKLTIFANQQPITNTTNNPCDISTWFTPATYYDNTIVMIQYNSYFDSLCTSQQWTINLQHYANNIKAVLIANNMDENTVYPLSGDSSLIDPVIPTRMISQNAAKNISNILSTTNEDIFVSIDCSSTKSFVYPQAICMNDPIPNSYSHHQTYYGVYILDTSTSYDGRYVYYNQRLQNNADSWYFVWYKEQNAWIINNDVVPSNPVIPTIDAICNDNVNTPDLCTSCWQFSGSYPVETNCDVSISKPVGLIESDCMDIPVDTTTEYTQRVSLCFDDGITDIYSNQYSGYYELAYSAKYNGRSYWHKEATNAGSLDYYIYYDQVYRFWVIDHVFSSDDSSWDLYCLHWDEFEPFNCNKWYSMSTKAEVAMTTYCFPTNNPTDEPSLEPTISPTVKGCSSNYAFVFAETLSGRFTETATSIRVDYAPYSYPKGIIKEQLVIFADGGDMQILGNNPCDVNTWTYPAAFYDDKVVMIEYNDYFIKNCSVQQWTLNLEQYANVIAVLVMNNADLTHVFSINGDPLLSDPSIPTRMISQVSGKNILNEMNRTGEDILISIDCFNSTHPTVICVLDDTMYGLNARFDGEYQQQSNILVNDHPVWTKEGMNLVWDNYYIWLKVDHTSTQNPWTWVIGTDYNNDSTVWAECILNTAEYIDDPTQCGHNWYSNGVLISNLTSHDGICDLGDNYVCATSGSSWFDYYFAGRYRQIHDGTPVWLSDNTLVDAFIGIKYVDTSMARGWSFVFAYASTGTIYAYCPIDEYIPPSREQQLSPYNCNNNWYNVIDINGDLNWINDPLMDIDECSHPLGPPVVETEIIYPKALCFMDPTYQYSHYQTFYGIYILDNSTTFNGRYVYHNQRLQGKYDEWYLLWYDAKDSWIVNQFVPTLNHIGLFEGICRDNVDTPDQCGQCWQFYEGVQNEINCNVEIKPINSTDENDCMSLPTHSPHIVSDLNLCFDDGITAIYSNPYTGKWELEKTDKYSNRPYWYKKDIITGDIEYYMYYDETWRFWVIHPYFTYIESAWQLFCLHWDDMEPHRCDLWYTNSGSSVSMKACSQSPTGVPTSDPSMAPTLTPTPYPTTECMARNKYIYAQSALQLFSAQTIPSSEVNFPPYAYNTFYQKKLVLFENGRSIDVQNSNPCDATTWVEPATFYDDKVVMIEYSDFIMSLCSPQQWTLQLEGYAQIISVIIANDADWNHVYSLSGDETLMDPVTSTRMISQFVSIGVKQALLYEHDEIYITFGCFNDDIQYPSIICLLDTSPMGKHVYLDGEYQRQVGVEINDHPVWLKTGHEGLWKHVYMFLDVDQSVIGDKSWKWVIGTDYNDRNTVFGECDLNGTHIDHPALCGENWYIDDKLEANITTSDTICELGDNYVCVESAPDGFFGHYFDGQYRQIHDGVSLWLLEDGLADGYITIGQISFPPIFTNNEYVFAFMLNQTHLYAFCEIGDSFPSDEVALSPWNCNKDWYVMAFTPDYGYYWALDLTFDIDECNHPNITVNETEIVYPQILCLSDPTNAYSHYQSHYGIYILDNTTTYDGKYVYYNQRLSGNDDEWYMVWYDEKDAWVINEMIPGVTYIHNTDGICREEVATPDLCSKCWEFYQGFVPEINCDVQVITMDTTNENDCISAPVNNIVDYTESISLCFDNGVAAVWDNKYTGKWILNTSDTHQGRKYWYKLGLNGWVQDYMFYDETWRFWVIGRHEEQIYPGMISSEWDYYCLQWDKFEPFNCDIWYKTDANSMVSRMYMSTDCESHPPTSEPTPRPTVFCNARETYINVESKLGIFPAQTLTMEHVNFAPYEYHTFYHEKLVLFENGRSITTQSSNPCDKATFVEHPRFYNGNAVMIQYSDFIMSLCSPQQWTLQLQSYAYVMAVIVANDRDVNHVYALSGDETLMNPVIPTIMIARYAGIGLESAIRVDRDEPYISFGCFDDDIEYPSIICLLDTSPMGKHVYLDGEYQRQVYMEINNHPIWLKTGHEGLWKHVYMFLDVDQSVIGDKSWRWVIGTDYNDRNTIIAECDLNGTHIDDPALCGQNWYINDKLEANITTSDTTCELGDNYVCVESAPGGVFEKYFGGRYRQIHDGVPVWVHDDRYDIYITLGQVKFPGIIDTETYAFAFVINQTNVWAFCVIGEEEPSDTERLSPYECNENWYVFHRIEGEGYQWVIDLTFDVDECNHPDIITNETEISYPPILCLSDPTNEYAPYQSHYGIYLLDDTTSFDDRYIYYNQRLKGNYNEWYMLWYDEKDSWIINEMVPEMGFVRDTEGICREDVLTPDLCTECWQFYHRNGYGLTSDIMNCDVTVIPIDSIKEGDCMELPVDKMNAGDYTKEIILNFDDGNTDIADNKYTGKWRMGLKGKYGDRTYWFKMEDGNRRLLETVKTQYYMFYDETWRYWVINDVLGELTKNEWNLYCLNWYDFEPFNCSTWYSDNGTIQMIIPNPTTISPSESTTLYVEDIINKKATTRVEVAWIEWSIAFAMIFCGVACCMVFYKKRNQRRQKKYTFDDIIGGTTPHSNIAMTMTPSSMISPSNEAENVQMLRSKGGFTYGTGTMSGKGETIAILEDDGEDYDSTLPVAIDGLDEEARNTNNNNIGDAVMSDGIVRNNNDNQDFVNLLNGNEENDSQTKGNWEVFVE